MPDASIFEGTDGPLGRVERLIAEVAGFYERSTGWWEVRQADRVAGDSWAIPEAAYEERFAALIRAAVAPLDADPDVPAVVGSVLVNVYFGLRAAGRTSAEAVEVERELLLPWLERRLEASRT